MKKKIWDVYAPIYEAIYAANRKIYTFMYDRIEMIRIGDFGGRNRSGLLAKRSPSGETHDAIGFLRGPIARQGLVAQPTRLSR